MRKRVICAQRRLRSACASRYNQGFHCPLTESLDATDRKNGEQMTVYIFFSHTQDNLNLHILRMFEDTFPLDAAHIGSIIFTFSIRTPELFTICVLKFEHVHLAIDASKYFLMCGKQCRPDQTLDLGPHCLLRILCPNTQDK